MPDPISALLLDVGKEIAKHFLKTWWQQAQERSTSTGLARQIADGSAESRISEEAEHQFSSLARRIAEELQPLFGAASGAVEEGEQASIIHSAADGFRAANLTPEVLASRDLDALRVATLVHEVRPDATRGFSEAGVQLYHKVIHEAALRIVAVAPEVRLGDWAIHHELLVRLRDIGDNLHVALDRLRAIESTSIARNHDDPRAAQFETAYLQAVAGRLDRLELFGVENLSNASRRQAVTVAFVSLRTVLPHVSAAQSQEPRPHPMPRESWPDEVAVAIDDLQMQMQSIETDLLRIVRRRVETSVPSGRESPVSDSLRQMQYDILARSSIQIEMIFGACDRVLIRGGAGSGKSTVLQWLVVQAALRQHQSPLDRWNDRIPFFLRLRDYQDGTLPSVADLPRATAGDLADRCPSDWPHALLDGGRAVVLIDGVDELAEAVRPKVRDWLVNLTSAYPRAAYIITSRPTAIGLDWLDDRNFLSVELQPLDRDTIPKLVTCWHEAVKQSVTPGEHRRLDELAVRLTARIRQSPALTEIARTPLLCALLCALSRDRGGEIPDNRLSLYEAACKMLVEKRDLERGILPSDYPALTETQKLLLLQDIAYWMLRNEQVVSNEGDVDHTLHRRLDGMRGAPPPDLASRVRRYFQDRSGLIRSPEAGTLEFVHNSFREYLAAQEILLVNDIGEATKNAHDDRWREVILMAAASAGRVNRTQHCQIVEQLIARGDQTASRRHQLHLLAAACHNLSPDADARLQTEITRRIEAIVPPRSSDEVAALATAGDLAVPYLLPPPRDTVTARRCIEVLGHVGTETALDALATYATDPRDQVVGAVVGTWRQFVGTEFELRILPRIGRNTALRVLYLNRTTLTDAGLAHLAGLASLQLLDLSSTAITDAGLAHLAGLASLQSLYLNLNAVTDDGLAHLASLPSLQVLYLNRTAVTDAGLAHLAGLPSLQVLDLGSTAITEAGLAHLAGIASLRVLYANGTSVTDAALTELLTALRRRRARS